MSASDALRDSAVTGVVRGAAFAHVAVETTRGPHVTPVLYTLAADRLWFTIPRGTLKARVLAKRPRGGILLRSGSCSVVLGGEARLLDPRSPLSWADAPRESALAPLAIQSFTLRNSRELLGFALDGPSMPAGSFPPNLLLAGFEPRRVALVGDAGVESRWGRWGGRAAETEGGSGGRARRSGRAALPALGGVPATVAQLPRRPGPAVVGWRAWGGSLALPADWDPDSGGAMIADELAILAGIGGEAPACIAFDAAAGRRPTGKRGLMLRGRGSVIRAGGTTSIRIDADRVTYWKGFATGTAAV